MNVFFFLFCVCVLHRNSSRKIASFVFYVAIQLENLPVDSADNLGVKNLNTNKRPARDT